MILAATRIKTDSGHQAVADHVLRGTGNIDITVIQGVEADLEDAMADARRHGAQYGIRHYHLDPDEPITTAQVFEALSLVATEFQFDPASAMVVKHHKARSNGGYDHHWHFLVPEVDPLAGKVMDASWNRARHEKLSRQMEARFGHGHTTGRWNKAVIAALREEGFNEEADSLEASGAAQVPRPRSSYSSKLHQFLKRLGLSTPKLKAALIAAWKEARTARELVDSLARKHPPMELSPGTSPGTWIVEVIRGGGKAPIFVGALDKLVRESKQTVAASLRGLENGIAIADELLIVEKAPAVGPLMFEEDEKPAVAPDDGIPGIPAMSPRALGGRRRPVMFTAAEWRLLQASVPKRLAPPAGNTIPSNNYAPLDDGR